MTYSMRMILPALILGGFVFTSCSKPDSVGIDVLPETDKPGVYYTDTITVEAYTIREDSLRSDEAVAAFNLVGSYTDPVFGLSRSSFYSQVRLPNNNTNFTFGNNPVLDSVVLMLAYADYYGDTLTPLTLEVFQLDQPMSLDSTYYTHHSVATNRQLFSGTIEARPKDSVFIGSNKFAPHLRLRLDDAFGNTFINAGNTSFIDNATFINYFKGIHVRANDILTSGQGVILSFNLLAATSKLAFYYTNSSGTTQQVSYFEINNQCPRFNRMDHDYTTSEFGTTFPVPGDNRLYIQSMAGLKVRLKFPHIKNFGINGPVAINKAELAIPVIDNDVFKNHQNLLVFGVDSAGKEALIPDLLESINYYGGGYESTEKIYKFNINRYVQQLISGKIATDYGLSLISSGGAVNAFRTVVPGLSTPTSSIRLRITYSKLN
jgi:hypothetical protein